MSRKFEISPQTRREFMTKAAASASAAAAVFGGFGLGRLGLFVGDLGADRLVPPPSGLTLRLGGTGHERCSFRSKYSRRSPPRLFQAVTPEESSGSTITVSTKPAVGE